jgi:hypothetical protein
MWCFLDILSLATVVSLVVSILRLQRSFVASIFVRRMKDACRRAAQSDGAVSMVVVINPDYGNTRSNWIWSRVSTTPYSQQPRHDNVRIFATTDAQSF